MRNSAMTLKPKIVKESLETEHGNQFSTQIKGNNSYAKFEGSQPKNARDRALIEHYYPLVPWTTRCTIALGFWPRAIVHQVVHVTKG